MAYRAVFVCVCVCVCVFVRQLISDSLSRNSFIALRDPVSSGGEGPPVSRIVYISFALDVRVPYAPEEHVRLASHACLFYMDQRVTRKKPLSPHKPSRWTPGGVCTCIHIR